MGMSLTCERSLKRRALPVCTFVLALWVGGLVGCGSDALVGPEVKVEELWSRPAVATGELLGEASQDGMEQGVVGTGAVFMTLVNAGRESDRLIAVRTDVAEVAEIHETRVEGDVMRMRHLPDGLQVPAGGKVVLKPGDYHIMLIGVKRDLNAGDAFPIVLEFEKSEPMTVQVEVREP
jgi:copper(I)-binding protein